jgi:hypothetical protein
MDQYDRRRQLVFSHDAAPSVLDAKQHRSVDAGDA